MSARGVTGASLAERLRADFDRSFAAPPVAAASSAQRFIAIRVGGDPYAVALAQVAEIHSGRRVAKLPVDAPDLLGVANVRGVPTPIYDLAVCLGYAPGGQHGATLLVRGPAPLGLAFDAVEVHLAVDDGALVTARAVDPSHPHVHGMLCLGDAPRPLVNLQSVFDTIARRAKSLGPREKET